MKDRKAIIENYIEGYNTYDVDKMVADFDENIVFENVSGGEVDMSVLGLSALKAQAVEAKSYFSQRKQSILSYREDGEKVEVQIAFHAVLAIDFPNGLNKGEVLSLVGTSVFEFDVDKIVRLTDIA
jgi:hypothetical protein